ncbi:MAG: hypothetical protein JWM80_6679 [Cyanobacteria bacterium RYN_339]|nr:hypothetical protein [Cyanobacteria bacterium RYN_339]
MKQALAWFGRAKREQAEVRRIAGAYLAWVEACHPWFYDAHADVLAALRDANTHADLGARIAYLDRLVARAA